MEGECENEKKETRVHGALGVLKNSRETQCRSQIHEFTGAYPNCFLHF